MPLLFFLSLLLNTLLITGAGLGGALGFILLCDSLRERPTRFKTIA